MMFPGWGTGVWMMAAYGLVGLLVLTTAVVGVIALSRRTARNRSKTIPRATELLAQRYARGEIDEDEYFQRLSVLDSTRAPGRSVDRAR